MAIIKKLNDKNFLLDGDVKAKSFIALASGDYISIINMYDSASDITRRIHYSKITIQDTEGSLLLSGATDLGTFTGTTISDDANIKGALQEIETAVEGINTSMQTNMCRVQAFTFESASTFDVQSLVIPSGKRIKSVGVQIDTPI